MVLTPKHGRCAISLNISVLERGNFLYSTIVPTVISSIFANSESDLWIWRQPQRVWGWGKARCLDLRIMFDRLDREAEL